MHMFNVMLAGYARDGRWAAVVCYEWHYML